MQVMPVMSVPFDPHDAGHAADDVERPRSASTVADERGVGRACG